MRLCIVPDHIEATLLCVFIGTKGTGEGPERREEITRTTGAAQETKGMEKETGWQLHSSLRLMF